MNNKNAKKIVVSENSTRRIAKIICSLCDEEVRVKDIACLHCGSATPMTGVTGNETRLFYTEDVIMVGGHVIVSRD